MRLQAAVLWVLSAECETVVSSGASPPVTGLLVREAVCFLLALW